MKTVPLPDGTYLLSDASGKEHLHCTLTQCQAYGDARVQVALASREDEIEALRKALASFVKSAYIKKQHPKRYAAAVAALIGVTLAARPWEKA